MYLFVTIHQTLCVNFSLIKYCQHFKMWGEKSTLLLRERVMQFCVWISNTPQNETEAEICAILKAMRWELGKCKFHLSSEFIALALAMCFLCSVLWSSRIRLVDLSTDVNLWESGSNEGPKLQKNDSTDTILHRVPKGREQAEGHPQMPGREPWREVFSNALF